jgi:hypothetical protein
MPGQIERVAQSASVVIVPVAKHNCVSGVEVDAQSIRIARQSVMLTGIEQDPVCAGVDPERKTMLRHQSRFTGCVLNEDGQSAIHR